MIHELHLHQKINTKYLQIMLDDFEAKYKISGPLNILAYTDTSAGYDSFSTYLGSIKRRTYFYKLINKYALITDSKWLNQLGSLTNFLTPGINLRVFKKEDETAARYWLQEKEVRKKRNITLQFEENKNLTVFHINAMLEKRDIRFIDLIILEEFQNNLYDVNVVLDVTGLSTQVARSAWQLMIENLRYLNKVTSINYRHDSDLEIESYKTELRKER